MPRTTAATAPPEDPPGVLRVSHGLRVTPVSGLSVTAFHPNSGIVVLPMRIAPCSRRRATAGASCVEGSSDVSLDPNRAGMPATRMLSLMPTGTPSMRPLGAPAIQPAVGVHHAVVPIDLIEHGINHLDRREIFAPITSEQLRDRQEGGGILWRFSYDPRSCVRIRSYRMNS